MADRTPVIVGVGLSDLGKVPHLDRLRHHTLAFERAIADAGVAPTDIDAMMSFGLYGIDDAPTMAEYLGIRPRVLDGTFAGGTLFELLVQHAANALRAGECETVAITYGSDLLSASGRSLGTKSYLTSARQGGTLAWEAPWGNSLVGGYALAATRHMHEYGTTSEQLAEIAVSTRAHAAHNPQALYRDPITVEDVLNSRMIADPLHMLDCCVVSDGGGALILTTAERAADLPGKPVYILGAGTGGTHWNVSQMPDFTRTGAEMAGRDAFARAGLRPADVDTVQLYDSFTITVLLLLEDLGFCEKGEGGAFVSSGAISLGGSLPLNTDGGGLSAAHPDMRGIFLLAEGARQLRGDAGVAQVPDCNVAMCCGSGGQLSIMGAVLLGREHP